MASKRKYGKKFNPTSKFNPESKGYDYESAKKYGIKPDKRGKWSSRVPETGLLLKGRKHKTWFATKRREAELGCKIVRKKDGRYYSICPQDKKKKK